MSDLPSYKDLQRMIEQEWKYRDELKAENQKLVEALKEIMEVTGTSTLQHKVAQQTLKEVGEG